MNDWSNVAKVMLLCITVTACSNDGWRTASREPAGIAPDANSTPEAVVQIYAADAWGWRGIFAVHSWIAVKPRNADQYRVYEVVGWRVRHGNPALNIYQDQHPDRYWYGARPELVWEKRGEEAELVIWDIENVVEQYPWKNKYSVFPGPNSNTFPAWVIKHVEGIDAQLPFSAIGSGYIRNEIPEQ